MLMKIMGEDKNTILKLIFENKILQSEKLKMNRISKRFDLSSNAYNLNKIHRYIK